MPLAVIFPPFLGPSVPPFLFFFSLEEAAYAFLIIIFVFNYSFFCVRSSDATFVYMFPGAGSNWHGQK